MKKFILKTTFYLILIFIVLELIVRIFHLYFQYPSAQINDLDVELYLPEQKGFFVTGNRRMNFVEYSINGSGFNSYREFDPSEEEIEIAIVGDSFIEGFHQDFFNSLGHKIERKLDEKVKVFEYGYSGYDLADQFNLITAYKDEFAKIDKIFIYLKYSEDLDRDYYEPNHFRANLENLPSFKVKDKIKLFSYLDGIGIFLPLKNLIGELRNGGGNKTAKNSTTSISYNSKQLDNFKTLVNLYNPDKGKVVFLIDKSITPDSFIQYCISENYNYLDFGKQLDQSTTKTDLVYDQHWNDHGRNIIAEVISNYLLDKTSICD